MGKRFILIVYLIITGVGSLIAQNRHFEDSIRTIVREMSEVERLAYLDKQVYDNISNDTRLVYARLLYDEGKKQNNEAVQAQAILILAKHFYSHNADSMRYWVREAEALFPRIGREEDLCRMKGWDIYLLNREGRHEEALQAVEDLKTLSRELSFMEGIEMADQALGDFYFSNNMHKEAEETYLSVLRRMEERKAPVIKKYYIIRQLSGRMPTSQARLHYLKMAEDILNNAKKDGLEHLDPENRVQDLEYVLHRSYAYEYIQARQFEDAWEHVQFAQQIADEYALSHAEMELAQIYTYYYVQTANYEKAIGYIDLLEAEAKERGRPAMLRRALNFKQSALSGLGRYQEAYQVTRELIALKDSINQSDFNKTLAEIRTQHEVEKLEIESMQMEAKAQQNSMRLTFWAFCSLVLLLIFLVLLYMAYVYNRKRKEINAAKEKAEEIDHLKTTFLSHINNEIRNPLNAIVGFSDILIDEEEQEVRLQYARIIEENNELLQSLIADVLDISKIESGSMVLFPTRQDIAVLVQELNAEMKPQVPESIAFVLKDSPSLEMNVDRNRLIQVLKNILKNAIKYTEQGHIHWGYQVDNGRVRFFVEDTGKGISEEQLATLFDRFAQFSKKRGGTSLGLAISRGLTIAMGGDISVKSEVGKGSVFYIEIPCNL